MGATKGALFSDRHNQLAAWAKSLAHPARIAILEHLMNQGSCVCSDIVEKLPLSQATVSQHLKAMTDAGILRAERDGTYRCYCLNEKECMTLVSSIGNLIRRLTKCC